MISVFFRTSSQRPHANRNSEFFSHVIVSFSLELPHERT